jgi:hypothetical protein
LMATRGAGAAAPVLGPPRMPVMASPYGNGGSGGSPSRPAKVGTVSMASRTSSEETAQLETSKLKASSSALLRVSLCVVFERELNDTYALPCRNAADGR